MHTFQYRLLLHVVQFCPVDEAKYYFISKFTKSIEQCQMQRTASISVIIITHLSKNCTVQKEGKNVEIALSTPRSSSSFLTEPRAVTK